MSDDAKRLQWAGLTHRGRVRANNEDHFLALTFDGHSASYLGKTGEAPVAGADFVFAVSDGMGGEKAGEFASRIAIDRTMKLLPRGFRLSAAGLSSGFNDLLLELFSEIHEDLLRLGRAYPECAGMGTTLSLAWFTPEWVYYAHVGDSRIYHLPAGGPLRQLTHDHTHVGWLRRKGELNEREARNHPRRNALQQALGAGHQFVEPQIGAVSLAVGDAFLLCTDGLSDGLWDAQVEEILRRGDRGRGTGDGIGPSAAEALVEESLAASGRDNLTALVVRALQ